MTSIMTPKKMYNAIHVIDNSLEVTLNPSDRTQYIASWRGAEDGSRAGFLSSLCGWGDSADDAMRDLWARVVAARRIVIGAYKPTRREVTWDPYTAAFVPYGTSLGASHLLSDD